MRNTYIFLILLGAIICSMIVFIFTQIDSPVNQQTFNADKEIVKRIELTDKAVQDFVRVNKSLPLNMSAVRGNTDFYDAYKIRDVDFDAISFHQVNSNVLDICAKFTNSFESLQKEGVIRLSSYEKWKKSSENICLVSQVPEYLFLKDSLAMAQSTLTPTPTIDPKSCGLDTYSLSPSGQVVPKSTELTEITQATDFHKYPRSPSDVATSNKAYYRCKTDTNLSSKNLYRQAFAGVGVLISESKWQERLEYFCQIPCLGNITAVNTCKSSTTQSQCDSAPSIANDCGWYACSNSCELKWTPTEFVCK